MQESTRPRPRPSLGERIHGTMQVPLLPNGYAALPDPWTYRRVQGLGQARQTEESMREEESEREEEGGAGLAMGTPATVH